MRKSGRLLLAATVVGATMLTSLPANAFWGPFSFMRWGGWDDWGPGYGWGGYPGYGWGYPGLWLGLSRLWLRLGRLRLPLWRLGFALWLRLGCPLRLSGPRRPRRACRAGNQFGQVGPQSPAPSWRGGLPTPPRRPWAPRSFRPPPPSLRVPLSPRLGVQGGRLAPRMRL